jgi:hypothetical protein
MIDDYRRQTDSPVGSYQIQFGFLSERFVAVSVFRCQRSAIVDSRILVHDFVMTKFKLCVTCIAARDDKSCKLPLHLVHPENGTPMVFDEYGMAVCPMCGAKWRRDPDRCVLVRKSSKGAEQGMAENSRRVPLRATLPMDRNRLAHSSE